MILLWLILPTIILYLLYKLSTKNYRKWEKLGVPYVKPFPLVGTAGPMIMGKKSMMELFQDNYFYFKSQGYKFGGIYDFHKPALLILDPDLVKLILIKDFDIFTNHRQFIEKNNDVIFGRNLFALRDQKWKEMRNILSPAFTTSKIKKMFQFVDKCGEQMVDYVLQLSNKQVKDGHPDKQVVTFEFKDMFTRFTNDVIASTAFGIEVNSLKEKENEFYLKGKDLCTFTGKRFFRFLLAPLVTQFVKMNLIPPETTKYFHNLIHDTIRVREEKSIVRPDMIHLLMQAKKGTLADEEENLGVNNKGKLPDLSDDDITAQAALFFIAGFDSSSTFLSFAAYALALHPDVQEKLYQEIETVTQEYNGRITYEGVMTKMTYLEMFVCETNRMYPGGPALEREASKRYTIPASDVHPEVTLEKGDIVFIPIVGFHSDPDFFPEPKKFDPERFNVENKNKIPSNVYLPFGTGPRNCIGMRFALMENKTCLVHLVKNFTFEVVNKTEIPLKMKKASFQPLSENGIWLGLKPRERK